jgi:hypothetical protein
MVEQALTAREQHTLQQGCCDGSTADEVRQVAAADGPLGR